MTTNTSPSAYPAAETMSEQNGYEASSKLSFAFDRQRFRSLMKKRVSPYNPLRSSKESKDRVAVSGKGGGGGTQEKTHDEDIQRNNRKKDPSSQDRSRRESSSTAEPSVAVRKEVTRLENQHNGLQTRNLQGGSPGTTTEPPYQPYDNPEIHGVDRDTLGPLPEYGDSSMKRYFELRSDRLRGADYDPNLSFIVHRLRKIPSPRRQASPKALAALAELGKQKYPEAHKPESPNKDVGEYYVRTNQPEGIFTEPSKPVVDDELEDFQSTFGLESIFMKKPADRGSNIARNGIFMSTPAAKMLVLLVSLVALAQVPTQESSTYLLSSTQRMFSDLSSKWHTSFSSYGKESQETYLAGYILQDFTLCESAIDERVLQGSTFVDCHNCCVDDTEFVESV